MNTIPPPIPGQTTPPPMQDQQWATIDPRFGQNVHTDNVVNAIILNEISKYTNENPSKATTAPIEKKKNITIGISAGISLIFIVLSQFFHWGIFLTAVLVGINLLVCYMFTKDMSLCNNLKKEVKARPDEPIENIVANASVEICKSKGTLRKGVYIGLVGVLPLGMFGQSHIFYETAPDGKYVRYYMDGVFSGETDIVIPETIDGMVVKGIRGDAFKGTNITSISLPNTIDTIRGHAFEDCAELREINLPENLEYIGGYAFSGCRKIRNITLPEKITEIHGNTFMYCTNLESVIINEGVTVIGGSAFRNCRSLDQVVLPHSLKEIHSSAFRDCPKLREVEVPADCVIDNRAFKNSPTKIYQK